MYIPIWGIIIVILIAYLYHRTTKKKEPMVPFWIRIEPKWYDLLKDYNLIDENTWEPVLKTIQNDSNNEYNVLQKGIFFTIIYSGEDKELVYDNNRHTFHSMVNFQERIKEIKIPNKEIDRFSYSPKLWVKTGMLGFDVGITTAESFKKVIMVGDDMELIKITTIPYSIFHMKRYRFGIAKQNQIEEQLTKNGLSRNDNHEEFKKDVLFKVADILEHKYFTIQYDYI